MLVYLNSIDRAIEDSAEVADGIVVDDGVGGHINGVAFLDASKLTDDPEASGQFGFESPAIE